MRSKDSHNYLLYRGGGGKCVSIPGGRGCPKVLSVREGNKFFDWGKKEVSFYTPSSQEKGALHFYYLQSELVGGHHRKKEKGCYNLEGGEGTPLSTKRYYEKSKLKRKELGISNSVRKKKKFYLNPGRGEGNRSVCFAWRGGNWGCESRKKRREACIQK